MPQNQRHELNDRNAEVNKLHAELAAAKLKAFDELQKEVEALKNILKQ